MTDLADAFTMYCVIELSDLLSNLIKQLTQR
jgi:hypothetical protein